MSEQQEQALVQAETKAVAVAKPQAAFITTLIETNRQAFLEANEGLDLDFVRDGEWLKVNKKGNFVLAADENTSFGDSIDILIGQGQKRFMLWGKDNTPEKGSLIVAELTKEDAEAALGNWLMENPDRAIDYNNDDIDLRYLCYLVMTDDIAAAAEDGGFPRVLLHDFPYGDTIGWGNFAKDVYSGKYKALGVPRGTGAAKVIVRMGTEDRKNTKDPSISYIGRTFTCVGMFNPLDFGFGVAE